MSVYCKEKPEYLLQSMQSIYNQTVATNDFILICDGPLTQDLDAVIIEMQNKFGSRLNVHRLEKNGGLGRALNFGIKNCKNDLIARMDSDDVSRPNRCEIQIQKFREHPEYSIISGFVEEFSIDTNHVTSCRIVPENQVEIIKFAKKRNPFNHPCVMYRKRDVEAVGGYPEHVVLLEDYYLWIRMLQKDFIGYNIQYPLLWMRAGIDMYKRRGGWKYLKSQRKFFKYMKEHGFISYSQYQLQTVIRMFVSVVPTPIRIFLFKKKLRVINREYKL